MTHRNSHVTSRGTNPLDIEMNDISIINIFNRRKLSEQITQRKTKTPLRKVQNKFSTQFLEDKSFNIHNLQNIKKDLDTKEIYKTFNKKQRQKKRRNSLAPKMQTMQVFRNKQVEEPKDYPLSFLSRKGIFFSRNGRTLQATIDTGQQQSEHVSTKREKSIQETQVNLPLQQTLFSQKSSSRTIFQKRGSKCQKVEFQTENFSNEDLKVVEEPESVIDPSTSPNQSFGRTLDILSSGGSAARLVPTLSDSVRESDKCLVTLNSGDNRYCAIQSQAFVITRPKKQFDDNLHNIKNTLTRRMSATQERSRQKDGQSPKRFQTEIDKILKIQKGSEFQNQLQSRRSSRHSRASSRTRRPPTQSHVEMIGDLQIKQMEYSLKTQTLRQELERMGSFNNGHRIKVKRRALPDNKRLSMVIIDPLNQHNTLSLNQESRLVFTEDREEGPPQSTLKKIKMPENDIIIQDSMKFEPEKDEGSETNGTKDVTLRDQNLTLRHQEDQLHSPNLDQNAISTKILINAQEKRKEIDKTQENDSILIASGQDFNNLIDLYRGKLSPQAGALKLKFIKKTSLEFKCQGDLCANKINTIRKPLVQIPYYLEDKILELNRLRNQLLDLTANVSEIMRKPFFFYLEYHKLKLGQIDCFKDYVLSSDSQVSLTRNELNYGILNQAQVQIQQHYTQFVQLHVQLNWQQVLVDNQDLVSERHSLLANILEKIQIPSNNRSKVELSLNEFEDIPENAGIQAELAMFGKILKEIDTATAAQSEQSQNQNCEQMKSNQDLIEPQIIPLQINCEENYKMDESPTKTMKRNEPETSSPISPDAGLHQEQSLEMEHLKIVSHEEVIQTTVKTTDESAISVVRANASQQLTSDINISQIVQCDVERQELLTSMATEAENSSPQTVLTNTYEPPRAFAVEQNPYPNLSAKTYQIIEQKQMKWDTMKDRRSTQTSSMAARSINKAPVKSQYFRDKIAEKRNRRSPVGVFGSKLQDKRQRPISAKTIYRTESKSKCCFQCFMLYNLMYSKYMEEK